MQGLSLTFYVFPSLLQLLVLPFSISSSPLFFILSEDFLIVFKFLSFSVCTFCLSLLLLLHNVVLLCECLRI